MKQVPMPSHAPRFTRLIATEAGGVWIERRPRPWQPETEYLVADSSGTLIARIEGPAPFSPIQIGSDWVVGVWRDADEVPEVRRYRILTRIEP
jgi:hypothetical protein